MYGMYSKAEVSFEYRKEIGQDGANSRAFIAHDRYLDALLVVKEIPKGRFSHPDLFFNESRVLYKATHPHVVQIQYACECDQNIYLALPYYENGSLKDLMKTRNLSVREIVRLAIQICTGLHNIHSKGLIHFDIKPDNILLSNRFDALVSDFGLSKSMDADFRAIPDLIYTKHIAPEHFSDKSFSCQYDIYQLGLTIYRMTHGESAFDLQIQAFNNNMDAYRDAICAETFPSRALLEHIPSKLGNIIKKCLKANLTERYQSALAVANDLASIDDNTLDWVYNEIDGVRTWSKKTDTHEFYLEVGADGSSVAKKKTSAGKWTMVKDFCSQRITVATIKRFLRSV